MSLGVFSVPLLVRKWVRGVPPRGHCVILKTGNSVYEVDTDEKRFRLDLYIIWKTILVVIRGVIRS